VRLFVPEPLASGVEMPLPEGAARHAMVRRVQPGDTLTLFDGGGSDWPATVLAVTRSGVRVTVGLPQPVARELPLAVTVAAVMPANERMDLLVEKATELGVARIQPLHAERSVLRLQGERAERKRVHWQAVAQAACEQCGRAVVPQVAPVAGLLDWLQALPPSASASTTGPAAARWLLSLAPGAQPPHRLLPPGAPLTSLASLCTLSGPEGGLTADEEAAARAAGFVPLDLGPRVLRAETAPLAVLAWLGLARVPV
jgi:16S rRNA (uracil1498-N3)-methyltransferase